MSHSKYKLYNYYNNYNYDCCCYWWPYYGVPCWGIVISALSKL